MSEDDRPRGLRVTDGCPLEDMSNVEMATLVVLNFLMATIRNVALRDLGPDCTPEEVQSLMAKMVAKASVSVLQYGLLLSHDAIADFLDRTKADL